MRSTETLKSGRLTKPNLAKAKNKKAGTNTQNAISFRALNRRSVNQAQSRRKKATPNTHNALERIHLPNDSSDGTSIRSALHFRARPTLALKRHRSVLSRRFNASIYCPKFGQ